MGVFSKFNRYREAGEAANVNNVERFGEPVRSLFTSTKLLTAHKHIDITDDHEEVVYTSETKFFSIHNKTEIKDAAGSHVAFIERKVVSFHERRMVTMADGTRFDLSNELFHLVKDITNIEGLGWQLRGNILALNFELYDAAGEVIAVIGQKMFSLHNKFCLDIYRPEYEPTVVTILIALQQMLEERQVVASSSSDS